MAEDQWLLHQCNRNDFADQNWRSNDAQKYGWTKYIGLLTFSRNVPSLAIQKMQNKTVSIWSVNQKFPNSNLQSNTLWQHCVHHHFTLLCFSFPNQENKHNLISGFHRRCPCTVVSLMLTFQIVRLCMSKVGGQVLKGLC